MRAIWLAAVLLSVLSGIGAAWAEERRTSLQQTGDQRTREQKTRDRQWAWCRGEEPALLIRACTALLQPGRETPDGRARAFFNRGRAWSDQGQHDKAIRDFDEAIRIDPRYPEAFNNRGIALGGKGQRDRAIQDFDEAIRIDPNYAIALHNRALALRALGRMVEADADVARARQAGPRLTTAKE